MLLSAGSRPTRREFAEGGSIMQFDGLIDDEAIEALGKLQKAVRVAFCGVMQSTRLPPMAAMKNLAAMAVGSLYLEVAAVHQASSWDKRLPVRLGAAGRRPMWKRFNRL